MSPSVHRDIDLIRELMFRLEALDKEPTSVATLDPASEELAIPGFGPDQIEYHLRLIYEAGYVETGTRGDGQTLDGKFLFRRLTHRGHDFIDSVRDPEVWKRTKSAATKAGGWTLGLLKDLGTAFVKQVIKERTGLDI